MHDDFIDEWEKLAKSVDKEKGNIMFELAKPMVGSIGYPPRTLLPEWHAWQRACMPSRADHSRANAFISHGPGIVLEAVAVSKSPGIFMRPGNL